MKPSVLAWSLLSLLTVPTLAVHSEDSVSGAVSRGSHRLVKREDAPAPGKTDGDSGSDSQYTTFNGIKVPPQKELTPENFQETVKDGYWFVKHYSPICPHCKQVAPTWQTLYEFYYTSDPLSTSSSKTPSTEASLNSFSSYYDFHFASMNCLAYADLCHKFKADFVPTFNLFHNGELVETYEGKKTMEGLSQFIEEKLEQIRPGSRPRKGVKLPEPGAKGVDTKAEPDKPVAKDRDPEGGIKAGEKHNEQAAQLASKSAANKPAGAKSGQGPKVTVVPNPQGSSVPLTAESFQRLVTTTRDPWFIKFYAPWCTHCQKLAPNWLQMAKEMKGILNIGEVNCDVETRLCKDARIKGYPTMYFFRGPERVEYTGLRGLGDLVNYAKRAVEVGTGVQYVDAAKFKELEEKEEVIFLYFYDHATTSEDFAALDRLPLHLVGHARLVKTDSAALAERFKISTWPRLVVSRDGRPSYYNALAPKDMRDFRQVLSWMQSVWLPIVPELTAANAREIMDGKYVVLGILTRRRSDEFAQAKRELKNAAFEWMDKQHQLFQLERQELRDAKQLRIEEAEDRNDQRALRAAKSMHIDIREDDKKQVAFAWVDGDFWERWLRTTYGIDVKNGERVIINDEDNRRYWDTAASGNPIMPSRTSILETIPLVIASPPKLKAKSTVGTFEAAFFHTRSFIGNHPFIFIALLAGFIFAVTYLVRGKVLKRGGFGGRGGFLGGGSGGGFFNLDGKEGLLNGGATGPVIMIGSLVGDSCILTSMRRFSVTENCSIPVKKADVCPESLRDFPPSQLIRHVTWTKGAIPDPDRRAKTRGQPAVRTAGTREEAPGFRRRHPSPRNSSCRPFISSDSFLLSALQTSSRMVFPTSTRRAAAGFYHSPYAPKYYTPPHIAGVNLTRALRYGAISAGFGASALFGLLFFAGEVPRVREDILQKIPVLGEHWVRSIPPEDNPF